MIRKTILLLCLLAFSFLSVLPIPLVQAPFTYGNWDWDSTTRVLTVIANSTNSEGNTEANAYGFQDIADSGLVSTSYYNRSQTGTQFEFAFRIVIADANFANTTWFIDIAKQITWTEDAFTANNQYAMDIRRYGYVRFGTLLDETTKATEAGCDFNINNPNYRPAYLFSTASDWNKHDRQLYVYASSGVNIGSQSNRIFAYARGGNHRFWHIQLKEMTGFTLNKYPLSGGFTDIYDLYVTSGTNLGAVYVGTGLTIDRVIVSDMIDSIWTQNNVNFNVSNVLSQRHTRALFYGATNADGIYYFIDWVADSWDITFTATADGELYRAYTFKINVTDTDGVPIENANVTMTDLDDVEEFSVLTGANGSFAEQVVTYGFYNQTGGNTPYMKTPHNLTITHSSYDTLSYTVTIDEWKTVVQVVLGAPRGSNFASGIGSGFILAFMICSVLGLAGIYKLKKH